jgi:hypothetical protein
MKQCLIEKQLNGRLKIMGIILLGLAVSAFVWGFFPAEESELDLLLLEIEEAPPPLNPYFVSSIFAVVGASCLFIYWKKKKSLSSQIHL